MIKTRGKTNTFFIKQNPKTRNLFNGFHRKKSKFTTSLDTHFFYRKTILSATYSISKISLESTSDENEAIQKKRRIDTFAAYNSANSLCYHHSKPISKMIIYEPQNFHRPKWQYQKLSEHDRKLWKHKRYDFARSTESSRFCRANGTAFVAIFK